MTIFSICNLDDLNDFNRFILFLSVLENPLYTVMVVTITDIKSAMIIMDFKLAPDHIMIIGPRATLGRLFKMVRYGSRTLAINLFHHKIMARMVPRMVPMIKLTSVSYTVM